MTDLNTLNISPDQYGVGDASYRAIGGLEGIVTLVERFYQLMDTLPHAGSIRGMHDDDLSQSKEKLVAFLSGWLGGPPLYKERYGSINLPMAHRHLTINKAHAKSWLDCMAQALEELEYPKELQDYLMKHFCVPADGIQLMSEYKVKKTADSELFHEVK
jgi:hemoglobin